MRKELLELIRSGQYIKFYKMKEWLEKRVEILKRDNYECQECKRNGKQSQGECVHHIKHLKDFPLLALINSNLITLCNACHNKKHPEKLVKNKRKAFTNIERWE